MLADGVAHCLAVWLFNASSLCTDCTASIHISGVLPPLHRPTAHHSWSRTCTGAGLAGRKGLAKSGLQCKPSIFVIRKQGRNTHKVASELAIFTPACSADDFWVHCANRTTPLHLAAQLGHTQVRFMHVWLEHAPASPPVRRPSLVGRAICTPGCQLMKGWLVACLQVAMAILRQHADQLAAADRAAMQAGLAVSLTQPQGTPGSPSASTAGPSAAQLDTHGAVAASSCGTARYSNISMASGSACYAPSVPDAHICLSGAHAHGAEAQDHSGPGNLLGHMKRPSSEAGSSSAAAGRSAGQVQGAEAAAGQQGMAAAGVAGAVLDPRLWMDKKGRIPMQVRAPCLAAAAFPC